MTSDKPRKADPITPSPSAHTPGPWEWWTSNSFRRLSAFHSRDGGVLTAFCHADGWPDIEVSAADARLIAAAPDLLYALQRMARGLNDREDSTARIFAADVWLARDVIAKATGGHHG